jgi:hypothetical protein
MLESSPQERKGGTFYTLFTILWSTLLTNIIYVAICWWVASQHSIEFTESHSNVTWAAFLAAYRALAMWITQDYSWLSYASIGFSGVRAALMFICVLNRGRAGGLRDAWLSRRVLYLMMNCVHLW